MRQRYTFHCFLFLQSRWLFDQAPLSKNKENVATDAHQIQGEWDKVMVPPFHGALYVGYTEELDCIVFGVPMCNQGTCNTSTWHTLSRNSMQKFLKMHS